MAFHLNKPKTWSTNCSTRTDLFLRAAKVKFGISAAVFFRRPISGDFYLTVLGARLPCFFQSAGANWFRTCRFYFGGDRIGAAEPGRPKSGSQLTRRWREVDSNHRYPAQKAADAGVLRLFEAL